MGQITKSKILVLLSGLFVTAIPVLAQAAQPAPPNAGNIQDTVRDQEFTQPKNSVPNIDIQRPVQPAMKHVEGFKTKVNGILLTSNTVFSEKRLQYIIASAIGREMTLTDLENVAAEISRFYRDKGYFLARAYVPAQEIKDGVVEIVVLEGRLGSVAVNLKGSGRLGESAVNKIVAGSARPGDVIYEPQLERGLLLANDLAGVSVDSTLVPGASVGVSDLVIEVKQTGIFNGAVDYDNSGNKFTGTSRVGASANFNNPARVGDQISLRVMTSGSGMDYGRVSYLLPVGSSGTKIGAAYSDMHYQLGGQFASTGGKGDASIASLYVIHPFIRSRNLNLYGQLGYDSKSMHDTTTSTTTDRHDNIANASFSGDSRDGFASGGMNSYSLTYALGSLDLPAAATTAGSDSVSAQTAGTFGKTNFSMARMQGLTDYFSLYAAISGQFASKNLDTSEKFVLGGSSGIRAYPQGEASGDQGQLLNVELRRDLNVSAYGGTLQLIGFYDAGHINLSKSPWPGEYGSGSVNPSLSNGYNLSGAGVGLNLSKGGDGGYSVKAYLATKIGSNPGAYNGNDSDGTNSKSRFWLQASKWF